MWIVLFSAIGGVNSILAFYFDLNIFRASNRYSIFLLALALLFLVARLSRLTRQWRPAMRLGFAGLVAAFGLWDQLPVRTSKEAGQLVTERVGADRRLGEQLESRLGSGAMVFQLPILDFPEGRPQLSVNEYDHFRPYLATRTLRFSYGETKDRARGAWQHDCSSMAPAELMPVTRKRRICRPLYQPAGLPGQRGEAAGGTRGGRARGGHSRAAGKPGRSGVACREAVRSRPWPAPLPSVGAGIDVRPASPPSAPHWTNGSASLSYYNPFPHPLQASVQLVLSSMGERTVRILLNGREQTRLRLGAEPKKVDLPAMELKPGVNRIDLVTPEPAIRVNEQRWRLRAIGVHRLQLRILAEPMVELTDEPDDMLASNTRIRRTIRQLLTIRRRRPGGRRRPGDFRRHDPQGAASTAAWRKPSTTRWPRWRTGCGITGRCMVISIASSTRASAPALRPARRRLRIGRIDPLPAKPGARMADHGNRPLAPRLPAGGPALPRIHHRGFGDGAAV